MQLRCRAHTFVFPRPAVLMGIVNITDDSFCRDGTLDPRTALEQARGLVDAGAEIIDVGAESARTNREPISVKTEIQRLEPFVSGFSRFFAPGQAPLLSINTWRAEVMAEILPLGGDLINDMSALPDPAPARLCAAYGAALLIMHSQGAPKQCHRHVDYPDILLELDHFFQQKIALAESAGLHRDQILLDPGIDFAKQREDNLRILKYASSLQKHGRPVLLPVSRKSVIKHTLGITEPRERDAATQALIAAGLRGGVQIFRVHHVRAAWETLRTLEACRATERQ